LYCSVDGVEGSTGFITRRLGYTSPKGFYVKQDLGAIRHLFNVAAGLDSIAVGEDQILRQVRSASLRARASGNARSVLTPLFDSACTSGERVRNQIGMASGRPSLTEIALKFAFDRVGRTPSNVLVAGTGVTAKLAASRLSEARVYFLTSRRGLRQLLPNAVRVNRKSLRGVIDRCELIVSGTRRAGYVFSKGDFPETGRRVVLDLGFPRNVDPAVRSLGSVELIDLDDVASLASKSNVPTKLSRAHKAVEAEATRFYSWLTATRLNPALASIFRWAEDVREKEASSALRRLPRLSDKERRVVEVMSRRLVSRLMAPHAEFVKGGSPVTDQAERLQLLEEIFPMDTQA
jgi:glutamyl-tRNA reductase